MPPKPTAKIDSQELENDLRALVERYKGEELIKELAVFVMATLFEVEFTHDRNPKPLFALGTEKTEQLRLIKELFDQPGNES